MALCGAPALRTCAPQGAAPRCATRLAPSTSSCAGAGPSGAGLRPAHLRLSPGLQREALKPWAEPPQRQSLKREEARLPLRRYAPARSSLANGGVEQESPAAKAILSLQESFQSLKADAFSTLPGDLKAELKDAGFALSSGPVLLELGEDVGSIVLELGGAMEAGGASVAAQAAERLCASLAGGALPQGSSGRAALGRRLRASGRFLTGMGPGAPPEVTGLGKAMARAGDELSRGSQEKAVDAAAVYGKRSFKVGNFEVEVTAGSAATGAVVAALFSAVAWKLASVVDSAGSQELASEGATLAASTLKQTLLIVGYGSATLSLISCIGLGVLALQLATDDKSS